MKTYREIQDKIDEMLIEASRLANKIDSTNLDYQKAMRMSKQVDALLWVTGSNKNL